MKKLVLLFTGLLMGLTTVTAAEKKESATLKGENLITRYSYAQPIQFVERGVEFLIFPDGSFDFNTNVGNQTSPGYDDNYYRTRTTRRGSINHTFGAPGTRVRYSAPRNRGVIITHDRDGKVRRIGNVFVNYNRYDQVKRLGSVYMRYNRQGWLTQVGGLHIHYKRNGQVIRITGHVNYWNQSCGVCGGASCSINHFDVHTGYDNDHYNDNTYNNDDFYYYKSNGKTKKVKKLKRKNRDYDDDDDDDD
ncbi:hypothetical protein [Lacinutrix salivirga]